MKRVLALAGIALAALASRAPGQDAIQWHGYVDLRAVVPSDQDSWTRGGLGKTRYGGGGSLEARFGGAALQGIWQIAPSWLAVADAQVQPDAHPRAGLLDAWLRFRPVSTTPWRWSAKFGAFFPPISLENDGIGWTSPWTLSPSAIDTWVGEELRTIGAQVDVEHRAPSGTLGIGAAVFTSNDPAGELLASRGWSLGDAVSTLRARVREPDSYAAVLGLPIPTSYRPFDEIDHRLGWYAHASWKTPDDTELQLLRYDNRTDPSRSEEFSGREVYGWHTTFWSLGGKTRVGPVELLAQVIDGDTVVEPYPDLYLDTSLHAAYVLVGRAEGEWRPAVRFDAFDLHQSPFPHSPFSEHGHAIAFALNWRPRDGLRVTGEWLRVDSTRDQRRFEGLQPRQVDDQIQLSARLLF